jgi:hypothetical protein
MTSLDTEHEGYDFPRHDVVYCVIFSENVWKELSASIFRLKVVGLFYRKYGGTKGSSKYCLQPTHYLLPQGNVQNIYSLKNLSFRQILFG